MLTAEVSPTKQGVLGEDNSSHLNGGEEMACYFKFEKDQSFKEAGMRKH